MTDPDREGARTVYLRTYGCQMNRLDSELVLGGLIDQGYRIVESPAEADLVLLNTCSVRDRAEQKVYSELGELARLKKASPGLKIGVLGCMARKEADAIRRRAGHVDLIVGPGQIDRIPTLLDMLEESTGDSPVVEIDHGGVRFQRNVCRRPNPFQAYVEVIRGCDLRCSFCVVPDASGPPAKPAKAGS